MVKLNYIMQRVITLKFSLDSALLETIPTFKLGINHYSKITVSESPKMLKGRLQLFQELLYFDLEEKAPSDFAGIKEWHDLCKSLGANPSDSQHSAEVLMQHIAKENYATPINSAIDLNTFFSLQYEIPIGIYDTSKIKGNVTLSIGNENDGYDGLNGRFNPLANIPILSDDEGPFGSPYVNSVRTAVTEETTDALHIFFLRPSMDVADSLELTKAAANMFTEISGGDSQSFLLHRERISTPVNGRF